MKNNEIMISVQFNFPNDSNKYSEKFSGITDSLAFLVKDDITLKAFIEGLYYGLHNNFPEHFILFKDYLKHRKQFVVDYSRKGKYKVINFEKELLSEKVTLIELGFVTSSVLVITMKRKLESQLLFDKIPSSYILDSDDNPLEYNISSRTLEAVDSSDIEILPPGDIPEKDERTLGDILIPTVLSTGGMIGVRAVMSKSASSSGMGGMMWMMTAATGVMTLVTSTYNYFKQGATNTKKKTEWKENYEKYWDDISPFIKYGCLKDTKFCDKMNDYILFKDINDKYQTLPELLVPVEDEKKDDEKTTEDAKTEESKSDDAKEEEKEPERSTIYYVTDKAQQGQYIKMFKEQGMNAVILDHNIDTSFITQLEQRNEHYQFKRIDADVTDALKSDDAADLTEETNTLSDLFKKTLNNDKLTVKVESLKDADVASILTLSEQGRRMQDMMKMYAAGGMGGMDPNMFAADQTLTLNANNALVKYLFEHKDSEHSGMFAEQLYDLAMLSNQPLSAEAMTKFVKRSNDIMLLLTK